MLEPGYDVLLFSQFMESKREQGDDIDMWELDELKTVSIFFVINVF